MVTTAERYRAYTGVALFGMGFRPFFLFASLWAALTVPLWLASFLGWTPAFTRDWHTHEMLFGYLAGVVAGFLLTAIPNWTGRLPVSGWPLLALFALWVTGRGAMLFVDQLGSLAYVIDSLFLLSLAAIVWREVLAGKNVRNLPVCVLVSLFAVGNIAFHLRIPSLDASWIGERVALAIAALLIALIGGRIVPSFTRNWMAKRSLAPLPAAQDRFDAVVLVFTTASLGAWIAKPDLAVVGIALSASGAMLLIRLGRWQGWRTSSELLVLILHIGYLWLGLALFLLGASSWASSIVTPSAGIHALAAGAIGVMTIAVMTRATRGHTGRQLTAPWGTQLIYALVNAGALARVAAAFFPNAYMPLLVASAFAWSAGFALFVLVYGPMLVASKAPRSKAR